MIFKNYISEILMGCFTMLGTLLGWCLNNVSQKGKLHIYLDSFESFFMRTDGMGGFDESISKEEAEYYNYDIVLDIYNSSRDIKIMRDIKVTFYNNKECLLKSIPQKGRYNKFGGSIERVSVQNFAPKSVETVKLNGGLSRDNIEETWKQFLKANRVVLEYTDEKNKLRTKTIRKSL